MTPSDRAHAPDVDQLAKSMLLLRGDDHPSDSPVASLAPGDDDDHSHPEPTSGSTGSWSKAPDFASDPDRAAAVREATARDRDRYLNSGLAPVDCRFCHVTVSVKKLGPGHTAVQWNSAASQRCAFFAEMRATGGHSAQARSCPRLSDSIKHAVAEGCLEAVSSAPSPGDG